MHFAVETMGFGTWSDPTAVTELAQAAEAAGWDGLFLWDHLNLDPWAMRVTDPWIALAGAAARTTRIRLGTAVTPLSRHAPHLLARTLVAVDRLSAGRVTLGVGLGVGDELARYGDDRTDRQRAQHADDLLDALHRLLTGETVTQDTTTFELRGVRLGPLPVQQPRPPIWIGGFSRPALRRAARWDGWIVPCVGPDGTMVRPADEVRASVDTIAAHRTLATATFDVAVTGFTRDPDDTETAAAYGAAGATWWLESIGDLRGAENSMARVHAGPPSI